MEQLSVLYLMKMNRELLMVCIAVFLFCIDLLTIKGVEDLIRSFRKNNQIIIYSILWTISSFIFIFLIYTFVNPTLIRTAKIVSRQYFLTGCVALFYLPKLVFISFFLLDDLGWLFITLLRKTKIIKKYVRLLLLHRLGVITGLTAFIFLFFGIVIGRFQYTVEHQDLEFRNLPKAFQGFKIVQLSDIHVSSFYENTEKLEEIFNAVMKEKPDMILISGDFVNYFAEELDGLEKIFYRLQTPNGIYAVLGNHDYGDYFQWPTQEEKMANVEILVKKLRYLGIQLLRNESVMIHRENSNIAVAGIENWGPPPMQQYGNLSQAMKAVPDSLFTILLSHDPRFWDEYVAGKTHIGLTLSGHTHGMQFGLTFGNMNWSPANFIYSRWAGLYEKNKQFLYVNRGLGYIGVPIRINMPAEITVFTLYRKR
jgi:uncharacterized protein